MHRVLLLIRLLTAQANGSIDVSLWQLLARRTWLVFGRGVDWSYFQIGI